MAELTEKNWTTAELTERGEGVYLKNCVACHQVNGQGIQGIFPNLAGSDIVLNDKERNLSTIPKVNKKPIFTELGNVTPIIIHPGKWSKSEIKFQARKIVTAKLNNSGFNCIAAQVIVLPKDLRK